MTPSASASDAQRLSPRTKESFRRKVYEHYRVQGRALPWRDTYDPYRILVSEVMLQQTQVERVLTKFNLFIAEYPDFACLAEASLRQVLVAWQGLGYNRRAASLRIIAQRVTKEFSGRLPESADLLQTLPGIGAATAGAICAFAFQRPVVFIETNIRRVFLHFFFPNRSGVRDTEIRPLVEETLDRAHVREWYYALMDYGSMLGRVEVNPNRRSAHHHRQPRFENSDRQVRGRILSALIAQPDLSETELFAAVGTDGERTRAVMLRLVREGLVQRIGDRVAISAEASAADEG